jgi:probable HAF family extracellular repeat protein
MKNVIVIVFIVIFSSFALSQIQAEVLYSVTDLDTMGYYEVTATGINNLGQVVGYYNAGGNEQGFRTAPNQPTINPTTDNLGCDVYPAGINDNGVVVGTVGTGLGHYAFYTSSNQSSNVTIFNLGTLGGPSSSATGISNNGKIVGWASPSSDGGAHAFLFDGIEMADLGTLGGPYSFANGVNSSGQVAGYSVIGSGSNDAFLFSGIGPMKGLGTLGGSNSYANGINESGQVVGGADISPNGSHAFLYSGGVMLDLGPGEAYGINNRGQVVGYTTGNDGFVYNGNGPVQDLNDLINPNSGWAIGTACAINDLGQIVCQGYSPSEGYHPLLLTPIPEPSTLVLVGIGAISLFGYVWRRRRTA